MLKEEIEYNDLVRSIEGGTELCEHQSDNAVDTEKLEAVELEGNACGQHLLATN